ncbi:MAG: Lrp/AsnC family transcriptional regulator [Candidatus Freyarchaeota archaeon]|nr:Lrp/AsnC family transcriptional regulator [Candidatus Jordarchaeia archaeon]MBS7267772.1 Lrp/AsnC family transcriptional regulator [Candidatus Jordarchaeia archaeon]MBS7279126.1 Lrp/AsnC family transcriptional regulator [Candidatus Jordarchaeia archaeon]
MTRLDDIDEKLIRILSEDSRKPIRDIAEELNLSIATVRKRIQRLVDEGIIKKFTVLLNPGLSENRITSIVTVQPATHRLNEIVNRLGEFKEVEEAHLLTRGCGLIMKVNANSLPELNDFIEKVRGMKGIIDIENCLVLRKIKE